MYEMKEALEAVSKINNLATEALYYGKEYYQYGEMSEAEAMMELVFESKGAEFNIIYLGWTIFSSYDDDCEWDDDKDEPVLTIDEHLRKKIVEVNNILLNNLKCINVNLTSSCSNGRKVCVFDHCEGLVKNAGCPHATKLISESNERMNCPYWGNYIIQKKTY